MKIKIAEAVPDFSLYPRHHVDDQTVSDYVHALKAGAIFPPIIVHKESHRIIDGFTRHAAHLRVYGEAGEIEVEFRHYRNEKEVLLDAIRLNTAHGQRISRYDMRRCVILCEDLKIKESEIALALNVTFERLEALRGQIHNTKAGDRIAGKQASAHLIDKDLSRKQADGMKRAGGGSQMFFVNQVISLVEHDLLDKGNDKLLERLSYLAALLNEKLGTAA